MRLTNLIEDPPPFAKHVQEMIKMIRNRAGEALSPIKDTFHRIIAEPTQEDFEFVQKVDDEVAIIRRMHPLYVETTKRIIQLQQRIEAYLENRSTNAFKLFKAGLLKAGR